MKVLLKYCLIVWLNCLILGPLCGQVFSGEGIVLRFGEGTPTSSTSVNVPVYLSGQHNLPGWEVELSDIGISELTFTPSAALPAGVQVEYDRDSNPWEKRFSLTSTDSLINLPNETFLGLLEIESWSELSMQHFKIFPKRAVFLDEHLSSTPSRVLPFIVISDRPNIEESPNLPINSIYAESIDCHSANIGGQVGFTFPPHVENLTISNAQNTSFHWEENTLYLDSIGFEGSYGFFLLDTVLNQHARIYAVTANYNALPSTIDINAAWVNHCDPGMGYNYEISNIDQDDGFTIIWNDSIFNATLDSFVQTDWRDTDGMVEIQFGNCAETEQFYYYPGPPLVELVINSPVRDIRCDNDEYTPGAAHIDTSNLPQDLWPLDILWSTGDTGLMVTGLTVGTYTCSVSANGECLISDTFHLVEDTIRSTLEDEELNLIIINDETRVFDNCAAEGQIILEANIWIIDGPTPEELLPLRFEWENGDTLERTYNLPEDGSIGLTITDAKGCVYTGEIAYDLSDTLFFPTTILSDFTIRTSHHISQGGCASSGDLGNGAIWIDTTLLSEAILPLSVEWSNGVNSTYLNNLLPGEYTCTITNAEGCTVEETIIVREQIINTIPFPYTVSADTNSLEFCTDSTGFGSILIDTLVLPEDQLPLSVEWSNGATGVSITNLRAGIYSCTITNALGCEAIQHITVSEFQTYELPVVSFIPTNSNNSCLHFNAFKVVIDSSTLAYSDQIAYIHWSNEDYGWRTIFEASDTELYCDLILTTGCSLTLPINLPELGDNDTNYRISKNSPSCGQPDGSITIEVAHPEQYAFHWNTGQTGPTIDRLETGIYEVTVTGINNQCSDTLQIPFLEHRFNIGFDSHCDSLGNKFITAFTSYTDVFSAPTFIWSNGQQDVARAYSTVAVQEDETLFLEVYHRDSCFSTYGPITHNGNCVRRIDGAIGINIGNAIVSTSDTLICIPVTGAQIEQRDYHILGYQGAISYDTTHLQFSHLEPGLSIFNPSANETSPGVLRFLGIVLTLDSTSIYNEVLFELCFEPKTNNAYVPILTSDDIQWMKWSKVVIQ